MVGHQPLLTADDPSWPTLSHVEVARAYRPCLPKGRLLSCRHPHSRGGSAFLTRLCTTRVAADVTAVRIDGVGHLVAVDAHRGTGPQPPRAVPYAESRFVNTTRSSPSVQ